MTKIKYGFWIKLLILVTFGWLILSPVTESTFYALSLNPFYHLIILAVLGMVLYLLLSGEMEIAVKRLGKNLKISYYFLFAPIAIYPLLRCYFKIPYAFCHVCPRKCSFGILRPYIIPSFLLVNLDKKYWCTNMCTFGQIQDEQTNLSRNRVRLPKILSFAKFIVLLGLVIAYFIVLINFQNSNTSVWVYKNVYTFSLTILVVVFTLFLIGFVLPRFWCNYFCPVGTISDQLLKIFAKK